MNIKKSQTRKSLLERRLAKFAFAKVTDRAYARISDDTGVSLNPQSVRLKPNYTPRIFSFSSRAKKKEREGDAEKKGTEWRMEGKLIRDFFPRPRGTRTEIESVRLVNPAVARNFLIPFSSRINGFPRARDPSKSPRRGLRNLASYSYSRDRSRFLPANARSRESLMKTCTWAPCGKKKLYTHS